MLAPPDTHHLSAAIGWLELGNPTEAKAELEKISATARELPDVLEVSWALHAAEQNWPEALSVARELFRQAPERVSAWLHQAYALRRVVEGGLEAAWKALLPAAETFPREATVPFNLACYACQMGRMDDARQWIKRALEIGGERAVRDRALEDEDLKPLWWEIRNF